MPINQDKFFKLKKRFFNVLLLFLFLAGTMLLSFAIGMVLYPNPEDSLPAFIIIIYVILGILLLSSGFFIIISGPVVFLSALTLRRENAGKTLAKKLPPFKFKFYTISGYIALGIILLLVAAYWQKTTEDKFNFALSEIQKNLAQATAAKTLGDSIIAGKKIAGQSMDNVKNSSDTASKKLAELAVPDSLKNYQLVSLIWTNEINLAAQNNQIWKDIGKQPGSFPLILGSSKAVTLFQEAVKIIAALKQDGALAIKNKDYDGMRQIAAKLSVQNHWLNGVLYSTQVKQAWLNMVRPVYAANQDPSQVPSFKGMDVTCLVCADPKVHWTTLLRQQYGCETRCRLHSAADNDVESQNGLTQEEQAEQNELLTYTYKDKPKRAICIGRGGTSTGNSAGNVFCVEDAVQSTNEIAASAIAFANQTKSLTEDQWNNGYKNVDNAFLPDGTIGVSVSKPIVEIESLEDGQGVIKTTEQKVVPKSTTPTSGAGEHREGGLGTVQPGEPIATPEPKTQQPDETGREWDGTYQGSGPIECVDLRGALCLDLSREWVESECAKRPDFSSNISFTFQVKDNFTVHVTGSVDVIATVNGIRFEFYLSPNFSMSGGKAVANGTFMGFETGFGTRGFGYSCSSKNFTATRISK